MLKKNLLIILLLILCLNLTGCAMLQIPFRLAGSALGLLQGVATTALNIAQQVPMPPPWLFFL